MKLLIPRLSKSLSKTVRSGVKNNLKALFKTKICEIIFFFVKDDMSTMRIDDSGLAVRLNEKAELLLIYETLIN
jgi:hypothetical protein